MSLLLYNRCIFSTIPVNKAPRIDEFMRITPLHNGTESLNAEIARFEPAILGSVETKNEAFLRLRSSWLEGWNSFRMFLAKNRLVELCGSHPV